LTVTRLYFLMPV